MEVVASSRKGGCKQSCQVFDHPAHDRAARSTLVYFTMSVEMQKHFGGISAIVSSGSKPLLYSFRMICIQWRIITQSQKRTSKDCKGYRSVYSEPCLKRRDISR